MTGQLERCLEAGMDGFLTKPLEIARLHETLDRYGLGVAPCGHGGGASRQSRRDVPVDLARLNELTDGDPEFAHELAADVRRERRAGAAGNSRRRSPRSIAPRSAAPLTSSKARAPTSTPSRCAISRTRSKRRRRSSISRA